MTAASGAVPAPCPKCKYTGVSVAHRPAVSALRVFKVLVRIGKPEHFLVTCLGCGYQRTEAIGGFFLAKRSEAEKANG